MIDPDPPPPRVNRTGSDQPALVRLLVILRRLLPIYMHRIRTWSARGRIRTCSESSRRPPADERPVRLLFVRIIGEIIVTPHDLKSASLNPASVIGAASLWFRV